VVRQTDRQMHRQGIYSIITSIGGPVRTSYLLSLIDHEKGYELISTSCLRTPVRTNSEFTTWIPALMAASHNVLSSADDTTTTFSEQVLGIEAKY